MRWDLPRPDGSEQPARLQPEENQYEDALAEVERLVEEEEHDVDASQFLHDQRPDAQSDSLLRVCKTNKR